MPSVGSQAVCPTQQICPRVEIMFDHFWSDVTKKSVPKSPKLSAIVSLFQSAIGPMFRIKVKTSDAFQGLSFLPIATIMFQKSSSGNQRSSSGPPFNGSRRSSIVTVVLNSEVKAHWVRAGIDSLSSLSKGLEMECRDEMLFADQSIGLGVGGNVGESVTTVVSTTGDELIGQRTDRSRVIVDELPNSENARCRPLVWFCDYCRDWVQRSSLSLRGQVIVGSSVTNGLFGLTVALSSKVGDTSFESVTRAVHRERNQRSGQRSRGQSSSVIGWRVEHSVFTANRGSNFFSGLNNPFLTWKDTLILRRGLRDHLWGHPAFDPIPKCYAMSSEKHKIDISFGQRLFAWK